MSSPTSPVASGSVITSVVFNAPFNVSHPRFPADPSAHDDHGIRFTIDSVNLYDPPKCLFV